ncbi:MAG: DOMON-like domain-containing protein [Sphingosinicella sp.]|nr:DOMON-like domain-containing protein [Sphingosinicella sp.]
MATRISLWPHIGTPRGALTGIDVEMARSGCGKIALRFIAFGNIDAVETPVSPSPGAGRKDGLWRHTCFEAFVRVGECSAYHEFNLAPSGDWACYRFDDYRQGMTAEQQVGDPRVETRRGLGTLDLPETPFLELSATLELAGAMLPVDAPWHLGLSAVIEEKGGNKSYWAAKHPPGKPDFHHPDCFALELAAARPA